MKPNMCLKVMVLEVAVHEHASYLYISQCINVSAVVVSVR